MTIQTCELFAPSQCRNDFGELYEALQSKPNTWLRVPLADLNGKNDENKRMSIRLGLALRGLRTTTRIKDGYVFVRTLPTDVQSEKAVA
jgi:hypothetical protein